VAPLVYILGTVVTLLCAVMLLRAYLRVGFRLLLWSAVCFTGLTLANALVYVDLVIMPAQNLYTLRLTVGAISMAVLVFGLVWESDRS
jgi:hypothetical protein